MNLSKNIVLFGAGKSATVLIDYLKKKAVEKNWTFTLADNNLELVRSKLEGHPNTRGIRIDIENETERKQLIAGADIVISMMPPFLHYLIAVDCIELNKNLLTASYIDPKIKLLADQIKEKGLLFIYEMGLDPGIDHMSAMKLIHQIKKSGGIISSFKSHCGGLVAPANDDNPWHYKISWNPRNVVLAGKAGAIYRKNGKVLEEPYETIFESGESVLIDGMKPLTFYPNRDSISYINTYDLKEIQSFIRTTLRYPAFKKGWSKIVAWGLTDETYRYHTKDLSIAAFFEMHFQRIGLQNEIVELRKNESDLLNQFRFIGLDDIDTILPMQDATAADILQFILETKLALKKGETDMVVMLHELEYTIHDQCFKTNSSLIAIGENDQHTAMAKTVGLPLGIATVMILEGKIKETGLQIPIIESIYEPVLAELAKEGIVFIEKTSQKEV